MTPTICTVRNLIIIMIHHHHHHHHFVTVTVVGCQGNVCTWTTGKATGKQRATGAHQQRLEHLPGKEKIILSKVYASMENYLCFHERCILCTGQCGF